MTTFAWVIEWMKASTTEINGHTEVVLTAGWRCNGAESSGGKDYTGAAFATCSFPEPAEGGSFTPYASLTQDQVLGWCWANGVDKDATEASLAAQIELLKNPVQESGTPWSA